MATLQANLDTRAMDTLMYTHICEYLDCRTLLAMALAKPSLGLRVGERVWREDRALFWKFAGHDEIEAILDTAFADRAIDWPMFTWLACTDEDLAFAYFMVTEQVLAKWQRATLAALQLGKKRLAVNVLASTPIGLTRAARDLRECGIPENVHAMLTRIVDEARNGRE